MQQPLVSIITVNYKQPTVTCELLDSIAALSYPNVEVIIVDNDQQYDDTPLYKAHYNQVKVLNCDKNLGFAGGNNVGIKAAKGDFVFLVNNDTELRNGTLETLTAVLNDEQVGAVSPVLRYFDAPNKIQYAGFTEINPVTGRNELVRESVSGDTITETPYIHGAAVMLRKDVIDQCGLMSEDYFLYYEELCWSKQIRNCGYELKVCHTTEVLHKESITTGKNSPLKTYYQTRNRLIFMDRNSSPIHNLLFKTFFLTASLPFNLLRFAFKRQNQHSKAFYRAFKHAMIKPKLGMSY